MNHKPARLGFLAVFVLGGFCTGQAGQAATLVEKGQARAVIIVPQKPALVVANAARVLRDHIKQMSGADYIVPRLHWNPEQDVDALLDDYCQAGFGPAGQSVRRYFERLETLMNEAATQKAKATGAFRPETLAGLRKELDQASKEAGNDLTIAKRVAFLELGLRWTDIEARAHAFLTDPAKADKEAARKTLDERFTLMREVFQQAPMALNVAYISWGEDRLWSRLGWKRPSSGRKP